MSIAVIRFPGTNNEHDVIRALRQVPGAEPFLVPSRLGARAVLDADGVILPGGFSYGDYLRAGAIAAVEEVMDGVKELAEGGRPILGICNGFQVLTEVGLLPGVLLPNKTSRFICKWVHLRVCDENTLFTEGLAGLTIRIPIAHAEGCYHCSDDELTLLEQEDRIIFRYSDEHGVVTPEVNPNGSLDNIAGIVNRRGNVLGMMPHPERAARPALSSADGMTILENFVRGARAP